MRLSRQQIADNEAKIRAAMTRLLNGGIPPGGKCDIKTLAGAAGVDRTAFYGSRPYAHLRAEFEQRLKELHDAGEQPDPRDAQVTRLQNAITRLKKRLASQTPRSASSPASAARPWPGSPPSTTRSPGSARKPGRPPASAGCRSPPQRSRTCHDQRPARGTRTR